MGLKTFLRKAWNLYRGRCEHYRIDCTWGVHEACLNGAVSGNSVCTVWAAKHGQTNDDDTIPQIKWM